MVYNQLTESDIQKVIQLYINYYNQFEGGAWTQDTTYKRLHQVVTREDAYGLFVADDHHVVGFCMGYFEQFDDGQVYHLIEILVAAAYQNKGIGNAFMKELEARVKEKGAISIQLQAVNDAHHEHFYGKLGYKDASNFVLKCKLL